PVISTDNPGGLELRGIFGDDVAVVARQDPAALAGAVLAFLAAPRRACPETARIVAVRFRLEGVTARYLALYRGALARGGPATERACPSAPRPSTRCSATR